MLRGVYVPLITPYEADGSVAVGALERLCHDLVDAGCAGLVALGTTGESPMLDGDEKRAVIDTSARVARERGVDLIVGAGTNSTKASVTAVEALAAVDGLTAVLVVVPYYVRPSQAGLVAHFEAVAAASPAPIVIYNIPSRTGRQFDADGLLRLARTANVAGVKQSTPIDAATQQILRDAPDGFAVLSGEDPNLFPMTLLGGAGGVTASAHVCTRRFVDMVECGLAGKVEEGRRHHDSLVPLMEALFAEPNPAVFKGVLHAQGRIPTADVRLPLTSAAPASVERALAAIEAAGG